MSVLRRRLMEAAQKKYIALTYKVTNASVSTSLFQPYADLSGFPKTMTVDGTEVPFARSYRFGSTGVHTVLLADEIVSIPNSAFRGCTALTSVGGLSSVTSIGGYAFRDCTSLTSVGGLSSVTSIGGYAFQGCTSLTSVDGLSSVTSIGGYAFRGCTSLTSVGGLSSATSIGEYAFQGCTSLTSVGDLSSATSIRVYAFQSCAALTEFVLSVAAPPQLGEGAFNSTTFNIYVPDAALDAYRTAKNWSNYASRIRPMSELNH